MSGRGEWTDLELSSDTDAVDQERLGQVLARINEVAAVPAAAARLLELTRNERSGFTPVVQALAEDPAMAAEVLRIANSPLYAQAEKVSDLKRAVTLIGMAELNVMAGAMAMLAAFAAEGALSVELQEASTVSAEIARYLSKHFGNPKQSLGYLAGLLCEIGAMACAAADTERYTKLWRSTIGDPAARIARERKRYGAPAEIIGARMLRRNQLPQEVVEAVSGSIVAPIHSLSHLQRVTIFSRLAAPSLLRASRGGKSSKLVAELLGYVQRLDLAGLGEMDLRRICADALTANGHAVPSGLAPPRNADDGESLRPERYGGNSSMPPAKVSGFAPAAGAGGGAGVPAQRKGWFGRFMDWLLGRD